MSLFRVPPYRNKKLLALASQAPECFHCRAANFGQVVPAHSNESAMGKGMGQKAVDLVAFLCGKCHAGYDGRAIGPIRHNDHGTWAMAAMKSLRWAIETHPEVFK